MIAASPTYSARVESCLIVDRREFNIASLGPERCILRQPADMPPSEAEIVVAVDGHEQRWKVFLLDGISHESGDVRFRDL